MFKMTERTVTLRLAARECESLLQERFLDYAIRAKIEAGAGPEWRWVAFTLDEFRVLRESIEGILPGSKVPHSGRYRAVRDRAATCLARYWDHVDQCGARGEPGRARGLAFAFAVRLLGIDPPIWRRFQVLDGDLHELHEVLVAVMNWAGGQPHHFEFDGRRYGPRDRRVAGADKNGIDETTVLLSALFPKSEDDTPPRSGLYVYDPVADWRHELLFAGHRDWDFEVDYPACLGGKRACPPEAAGGVAGYRQFLAGPSPDRERILASVLPRLRPFHPETFNLKKTAAMLKEIQPPPAWQLES